MSQTKYKMTFFLFDWCWGHTKENMYFQLALWRKETEQGPEKYKIHNHPQVVDGPSWVWPVRKPALSSNSQQRQWWDGLGSLYHNKCTRLWQSYRFQNWLNLMVRNIPISNLTNMWPQIHAFYTIKIEIHSGALNASAGFSQWKNKKFIIQTDKRFFSTLLLSLVQPASDFHCSKYVHIYMYNGKT